MPHISKRRKAVAAKVDRNKTYGALDALKLIKETATAKFDEAVDVAVNLGIDAKKGDQTVRGSVVLPAGTWSLINATTFFATRLLLYGFKRTQFLGSPHRDGDPRRPPRSLKN